MAEPDPDLWPRILQRLIAHESLSADEAASAMRAIMSGDVTPGQVGGFLMALRTKGETVDELDGRARAALEFATPVVAPRPVLDTCGTGGDRSGTFNISTRAAIVAAGAGATVAKHGNRAASSRCGSADLLEALGVAIDLEPEGVAACIEEAGIGFCFAPVFHPGFRHAAVPRRELGVPTVFNFLGPLANPAGARRQVVGVGDPPMAELMIGALAELGSEHALVFHGHDGLDELTTTTTSMLLDVSQDGIRELVVDPVELGIPAADREDLLGGDVERNV